MNNENQLNFLLLCLKTQRQCHVTIFITILLNTLLHFPFYCALVEAKDAIMASNSYLATFSNKL